MWESLVSDLKTIGVIFAVYVLIMIAITGAKKENNHD